jgi:hypothetical protein
LRAFSFLGRRWADAEADLAYAVVLEAGLPLPTARAPDAATYQSGCPEAVAAVTAVAALPQEGLRRVDALSLNNLGGCEATPRQAGQWPLKECAKARNKP